MNIKRIFQFVLAATGIVLLASCKHDPKSPGLEFMPDMYRSPSYETYQEAAYFKDSVSALHPVDGTIPRGFNTHFPYPHTNEGYEAAGAALKNPVPENDSVLAEGKRLYMINCKHCHGEKGDGKGTLRIKGEPFPVPSYFDDAHINLEEGKMYYSIVYGKNLMGSHAYLLNPEERWMVIHFIKSLQKNYLTEKNKPAVADTSAKELAKK